MIRLFINALAASAGGGVTYLRNVLRHLAARSDVQGIVLVNSAVRNQFESADNLMYLERKLPEGVALRFWFEQGQLPDVIRRSGAHILLSAGNFALWNSPIPQILLSRNALYTSGDFLRDLRNRGDYALWLDTELKAGFARWSVRHADVTVAPSRAFADELRQWTGIDVTSIHHGFDQDAFEADCTPLPIETKQKLDASPGAVRLLFVSHYNYYRNFETLLRALPVLRDRIAPRKVCLILTCKLRSEDNPGSYRADSAAALVEQLGVSENVIELGSIPYTLLHQVYRACGIYLSPAYAESFAHPLVEAMSCGLPVVAADIRVHREICGDAALFFRPMSAPDLAEKVCRLLEEPSLAGSLGDRGQRRSRDFSWRTHVQQLLDLACSTLQRARLRSG